MEDKIVVSVTDRDENNCRRATVLDDADGAARLVEGLIAAGCDASDISVFRSCEVELEVAYSARVSIRGEAAYGEESWFVPPAVGPAPEMEPFELPLATTPVYAEPVVSEASATSSLREEFRGLADSSPPVRGGWGFQLRADRVVWLGIWTVSVAILLVAVLTTFSRPAPREFIPGAPTSDAQGLAPQNDTTALDSAASPLIDEGLGVPECAQGGQANCHCGDFASQADAQAYYERFPPAEGNVVDTEGDGVFCEWLPTATTFPTP